MEKKLIRICALSAILAVGIFLCVFSRFYPETALRLVADLAPADLSGIVSNYPNLCLILLMILIILSAGYGIYWYSKRKKK